MVYLKRFNLLLTLQDSILTMARMYIRTYILLASSHPYAGQERPKAGQPDLIALVLVFHPEWNNA